MPKTLSLPWGKEQISVEMPESWTLRDAYEPQSLPPVADPAAEAARSLTEPVGSARLSERLHPGSKVALVIDDGSRPTPVHLLYPSVLEDCTVPASLTRRSPWCLPSGFTGG